MRLDHAEAYVPPESPHFASADRGLYIEAVARAWQSYRQLGEVLAPDARGILADMWHLSEMSHPKRVQKVQRQSEKRVIEVARYVLPVAAFTAMVHTVSGIVLHGLGRKQAASDTPTEARAVIGEMVDFSPRAIGIIGEAYRRVLGLTDAECPDGEAVRRLLNPRENPYRHETLDIGVNAPMMRALQHAHFTFAKKISHMEDSQDQRHRMVPGSRPLVTLADTRKPDYITPLLIRENPRAWELYEEAWTAKNQLVSRGVPLEFALHLLPNAKAIRIIESGSLLHLLHMWTMRTCFNAQEEIYQASIEEVEPVRAALPALGRYIGPPVPFACRRFDPDLHRRLAILRCQGLAGFPQHPPPHVAQQKRRLSPALSC